jgi:hypothetical protein
VRESAEPLNDTAVLLLISQMRLQPHFGKEFQAIVIDHTDMVDVDQISATIARDCPDLRGLGGRTDTLSTQTATDAKPPVRAHFGLAAQS